MQMGVTTVTLTRPTSAALPEVALPSPNPPGNGHPRRWPILYTLCSALLVMSSSVMAVTIALPAIALDLRASTGQLQWITETTVLALASLLITMGTLADRWGRRRMLLAGLAAFAVASLLAAVSRSPAELVAARALLGVGNAMIMPSTLSIIRSVFPRSELPRALAVWGMVASIGVVVGPLAGGLLVQHLGWRALFLVSVPAALASACAITLLVPAFAGGARTALDLPGMVLVSAGFVTTIYTIIEAPHRGWSAPPTLATAALAGTLLAGFVLRQRRTAHPLLDLRMAGARSFWPAALAAAAGFFSLMGILFLLTQYLQDVRGHTPSEAALVLLPLAAGQLGMAPLSPRLIDRCGTRTCTTSGLLILAAGLALLPLGLGGGSQWPLMTALAVLAAGNALTVTAAGVALMGTATRHRAGSAAAVNETAFKLGGSLGVAVLGSVATSHLTGRLSTLSAVDALPAFATESITGAMTTAARLGGPTGDQLALLARDAFMTGFTDAAHLSAGLALAAAAVTAAFLTDPNIHNPEEERP
ncbi:MFS transporter [Nonomuraea sp. NPDC059023]|uniref:MFS transporter n=1 Tax=unclassified Nonomuraea TaxID=2593643 RepID=UPI003676BB35